MQWVAVYLLLLEASLYPFSDNFVCFDGSATVGFENINDNYCDCADGSDEPGVCLLHITILKVQYDLNCVEITIKPQPTN